MKTNITLSQLAFIEAARSRREHKSQTYLQSELPASTLSFCAGITQGNSIDKPI